jgi:hypothetical protein
MNDEEEAGSDKVTADTRAFEEIDAQVFPGPGRGATPSEAAASDRWGAPSADTVEAYRRMFDVVARHQRAVSECRASIAAGSRPRRTPASRGGDVPGQQDETAERRRRGVQRATSCATEITIRGNQQTLRQENPRV